MNNKFNGLIVYVAGSYRAEHPYQVNNNIQTAKEYGDILIQLGIMPLIPHKNTEHCEGLNSSEFFLEGTMELMRRSNAVFVIPGFETSSGTLGEIAEAENLRIPVFYDMQDLRTWVFRQS